eukprot:1733418-Pyramimonas_sp.AAC.1
MGRRVGICGTGLLLISTPERITAPVLRHLRDELRRVFGGASSSHGTRTAPHPPGRTLGWRALICAPLRPRGRLSARLNWFPPCTPGSQMSLTTDT